MVFINNEDIKLFSNAIKYNPPIILTINDIREIQNKSKKLPIIYDSESLPDSLIKYDESNERNERKVRIQLNKYKKTKNTSWAKLTIGDKIKTISEYILKLHLNGHELSQLKFVLINNISNDSLTNKYVMYDMNTKTINKIYGIYKNSMNVFEFTNSMNYFI